MSRKILNESYDFISPLVSVGMGLVNSPFLINTYLKGSVDYPFNVIYFLFKIKDSHKINNMEEIAQRCPNYVECFDLTGNRFLYVFIIPDHLHSDFYKILNGDYSKISKDAKKLFPKYEYLKDKKGEFLRDENGQLVKELTVVYNIISKGDDLINHWAEMLNVEHSFFLENDIELYEKKDISKEKNEKINFKPLDK